MTDIIEQARAEAEVEYPKYPAGQEGTDVYRVIKREAYVKGYLSGAASLTPEPSEWDKRHADHWHAGPYCMPTPEPREDVREAVRNALATVLDGQEAMHCTRDWSAWAHGTMTTDDFTGVTESEDALNEIVDAVMHALALTVTPKPTNDSEGEKR